MNESSSSRSYASSSLNNLAPQYMNDMFCYVKDVHNRSTRISINDNLYIPNAHKKSLRVTGSLLWNSLDLETCKSLSLKEFKKKYWSSRSAT